MTFPRIHETLFRVGIGPTNLNYSFPSFCLPFIFYRLLIKSKIDYKTTLLALQQLSEFISEDEFGAVRLLMEKEK